MADFDCLMSYHSFWHREQVEKLLPRFVENWLPKMILSAQAAVWLVPSEFHQVPAYLLGSALTCGPLRCVFPEILSSTLPPYDHELIQNAFHQ